MTPPPVYAQYHYDGEHYYTKDGWLHREDGPAFMEDDDQIRIWALDGVITTKRIPGNARCHDCIPAGIKGRTRRFPTPAIFDRNAPPDQKYPTEKYATLYPWFRPARLSS